MTPGFQVEVCCDPSSLDLDRAMSSGRLTRAPYTARHQSSARAERLSRLGSVHDVSRCPGSSRPCCPSWAAQAGHEFSPQQLQDIPHSFTALTDATSCPPLTASRRRTRKHEYTAPYRASTSSAAEQQLPDRWSLTLCTQAHKASPARPGAARVPGRQRHRCAGASRASLLVLGQQFLHASSCIGCVSGAHAEP